MFRFEEALAQAQADEGMMPASAARAIAGVCKAQLYDIPALISAGRRAGSLAIPLVKELTKTVALYDEGSGQQSPLGQHQPGRDRHRHGAGHARRPASCSTTACTTSQAACWTLAGQHLATPVLARTLMQPAQVTSFGFKLTGWLAPLVRSRARLRECAARALQLQLGGAVGTLAVMGDKGQAVAGRMSKALELRLADAHGIRSATSGCGLAWKWRCCPAAWASWPRI
jgi:3-carboxy-cis,cis-muconate cycloisomerase